MAEVKQRMSKLDVEACRPHVNESAAEGQRLPALIPVLIAVIAFWIEQRRIATFNGFWLDEYFSIWASDPATSFIKVFTERIWPDSNPPLYFSALYATRLLIEDPRAAMTALNVAAIFGTGIVTLASARRRGAEIILGVCFALFLLSGPVSRFTAEGRSYLVAMCLTFCASWFVAERLEGGQPRGRNWPLAIIGGLSALTHVFGALFCCALATGLFSIAVWRRRSDLYAPALWLGLSAGLTTLIWMLFALQHVSNISWIKLDGEMLKATFWEVRTNAVGPWVVAAIAALLIGWGLVNRAIQNIVVAFTIAFALFLIVPLVASLKMPMITARYWLIGAPGLSVLITIVASGLYRADKGVRSATSRIVAVALFIAFALGSSVGGWAASVRLVKSKPLWLPGSSLARDVGANCGDGSIAVLGEPPIYALASGLPESVFRHVDQKTPLTPPSTCPMIGWAEHLDLKLHLPNANPIEDTPAATLIDLLRLEIEPSLVEVRRRPSGVTLLRRDRPGP